MAVEDDPPADVGVSGSAAVELKEMVSSNKELEVAVLRDGERVQEECVLCVITDETTTDWQKSRFSYSLPLSSDVRELYLAVAKQAGTAVLVHITDIWCTN